jgi:hypothetical protein
MSRNVMDEKSAAPSELLKVGDRLAKSWPLTLRAGAYHWGSSRCRSNPWSIIGDKYPVGTKIEGQIKNVTDFEYLSAWKKELMVLSMFPTCPDKAYKASQ